MSKDIDISQWSNNEIMTLPDHAFGERRVLTHGSSVANVSTEFHMAIIALPDRMVIWNIKCAIRGNVLFDGIILLALGNRVPADLAEFNAFEPIGQGGGFGTGSHARFLCDLDTSSNITSMKLLIQPQGRRLILRLINNSANTFNLQLTMIYSAVPKSIPLWIIGSPTGRV